MVKLDALRDLVGKHLDIARDRQAGNYNRGRRDISFVVGDKVWRRVHVLSRGQENYAAKLAPRYEGPFEISEVKSPTVYVLNTGDSRKNNKVHVSQLKPFIPPPTTDTASLTLEKYAGTNLFSDLQSSTTAPKKAKPPGQGKKEEEKPKARKRKTATETGRMYKRIRLGRSSSRSSQHRPTPEFEPTEAHVAHTPSATISAERRAEMIRQAELISREIELAKQADEKRRREAECDKRASAAEARASKSTETPLAAGPSEREFKKLPRIPRKKSTVTSPYLLYSNIDENENNIDEDIIEIDDIDQEIELTTLFLQEAEEKPTALVLPNATKWQVRSLPIERRTSQGDLEWDQEASTSTGQTATPAAARPGTHTGAIPRSSRSRSSRRERSPPPRVVGPADLPVHELWGSRTAAPGEGKHRKKRYNPNRHFQKDDFVFSCLDDAAPPERTDIIPPPTMTTHREKNPTPPAPKPTTEPVPPIQGPTKGSGSKTESLGTKQIATKPVSGEVVNVAGRPKPTERQPHGLMWTPRTGFPFDDEDPPVAVCYNCWSPDHNRGKCPRPLSLFCRNCGRRGADVAHCQRCGPEYDAFRSRERLRKQALVQRKKAAKKEAKAKKAGSADDNTSAPTTTAATISEAPTAAFFTVAAQTPESRQRDLPRAEAITTTAVTVCSTVTTTSTAQAPVQATTSQAAPSIVTAPTPRALVPPEGQFNQAVLNLVDNVLEGLAGLQPDQQQAILQVRGLIGTYRQPRGE